jgi:hypothetical protein
MLRFVVIGNPENRRVAFFQQALERFGFALADVLSYEDLLTGRRRLDDVLGRDTIVRIESPGENAAVEKLLLKLGVAAAESEGSPAISPARMERLADDPGRILHPRQWYLGFRRALREWGECIGRHPQVRLMNSPAEIEILFDKIVCHAQCQTAGIPVPESLPAVGSYDELLARMDETGRRRVFVKLAHGSSASGVVAFHRHGARQEAVTSAELVRSDGELRLYNSLKVRRYTDLDEIRDLVDALCRERVHVEAWLPKASTRHNTVFDLRIVTIAGEPRHWVVRESRGPMTNLHLGNRRGDSAAVRDRMGPPVWAAVEETCRQTASQFSGSLHLGIDLLLTPGFRRHAVLEVNAFGDLLPGILADGLDTYSAQVAALPGWMGSL